MLMLMLIRLNEDYLIIFYIKMETKISFLVRIQNHSCSLVFASQVALVDDGGVFRLYAT